MTTDWIYDQTAYFPVKKITQVLQNFTQVLLAALVPFCMSASSPPTLEKYLLQLFVLETFHLKQVIRGWASKQDDKTVPVFPSNCREENLLQMFSALTFLYFPVEWSSAVQHFSASNTKNEAISYHALQRLFAHKAKQKYTPIMNQDHHDHNHDHGHDHDDHEHPDHLCCWCISNVFGIDKTNIFCVAKFTALKYFQLFGKISA